MSRSQGAIHGSHGMAGTKLSSALRSSMNKPDRLDSVITAALGVRNGFIPMGSRVSWGLHRRGFTHTIPDPGPSNPFAASPCFGAAHRFG